MTLKSKKIYLAILALLISLPLILMPFFVQKNNTQILRYNKKYPMSLKDIEFNKHFFRQVEIYFNEHVPERINIITIWAQIWLSFGVSTNNDIVIGREGMFYFTRCLEYQRNRNGYSPQQMGDIINKIAALQHFCSEHEADFLFVVAPNKPTVYPEYLPRWFTSTGNKSFREYLFEQAAQTPANACMLDLSKPLLKAKKKYGDTLYPKTDSHWSSLGAYVGYNEIIEKLNSTYEIDLAKVDMNGYDIKSVSGYGLRNHLGRIWLNDFKVALSTSPKKITPPEYLKQKGNWNLLTKYENNNALQKNRVLFLRDSFGLAPVVFLTNTFSEVYCINAGNPLLKKKPNLFYQLINSYKPQVIIFEMVERMTPQKLFNLPVEYDNPKNHFNPDNIIARIQNDSTSRPQENGNKCITIEHLAGKYCHITLKLDISVSEYTTAEISHADENNNEFTNNKTIEQPFYKGSNLIYLTIDSESPITGIKIKPLDSKTDFVVEDISVSDSL